MNIDITELIRNNSYIYIYEIKLTDRINLRNLWILIFDNSGINNENTPIAEKYCYIWSI